MLGARDEQTTAGTRAPAKGQAYPAKDAGRERTDDMESEEENQPKDETNAPKGDPTVETFHLPPELDAFKDEALPKLQVKTPSKKLTEDELAALRRKESLFRLIEKAGVFTNWVTSNLENARLEMVKDHEINEAAKAADEGVKEAKTKRKKKKQATAEEAAEPERRSARDSTAAASATSSAAASTADSKKRKSPEDEQEGSPKKTKKTKAEALPPVPEDKRRIYDELPTPLRARQPALVTGGIMRDYQLFGTEWLITLYENGFNGILADEMGLGKTLQTIGFLAHIRAQDVKGFVLIVAPLSVLDNWISEFERFAPLLKVERYHGTPSDRLQMRENWKRLPERERPIIVTSFEIAIRDRSALAGFTWKYLAVDEGHRLKNMDSKLLRDLKSLNSENRVLLTGTPLQNNLAELWSLLNFCLPEVFSSLQEFQSWFDFESDLSNAGGENSILNKEEKDKVVTHLHTILRPFLLRRVKSDVEASLPKKKEYLLYAPLTPFQHKLYSAALTGSQALRTALAKQSGVKDDGLSETASTADVDEMASTVISSDDEAPRRTKRAAALTLSATGSYSVDSGSETAIGKAVLTAAKKKEAQKRAALAAHAERASKPGRGSLNNLLMQLRKICNHPYLFEGTEEEDEVATLDDSDDEVLKGNVRKQLQSSKVGKGKGKQKLPDIVIKSGKMLLLERLLPVLFERGHKVLIFSQMVNILYILEEWCVEYKGWKCSRLDGGVSLDDRKTAINNFNNDPDTKIFLLSTRAGGLGINLVAADTVILFDSDWNPQADLQAQDRAHRIGQTKPVIVYRLVTEGTVEAKILEKARSKRKLEKIVMQGGAMRALPGRSLLTKANLSLDDLAQALYSTDAESFKLSKLKDDEVPSPEDILNAEELEKLLDRSFGTPDAAKAESSTPAKRGKKSPAKKSSDKEPSAASRFEEIGDGAWTNENADALAEHGAEATGK